jgi:hypothetical protein
MIDFAEIMSFWDPAINAEAPLPPTTFSFVPGCVSEPGLPDGIFSNQKYQFG